MAIEYLGAKRLQGLKSDRVADSLASSADGTNSGITFNAVKDYAVFDGSNDYITFATKFNEMQQSGSFSVWIKPANIASTGNDIIFDNSDVSSSNNGFSIRHSDHSGGKTLVLFGIWGSTDSSISTGNIWTGDEWQHLVVTYDGTTGKIYRNGKMVKSGALTANSGNGDYNARIGFSANGNDHKFEGGMAQALVYNDALTQSEVTTLYNNGTPIASPSTSGLVSKYNLSSDTNDSQGSNNGTNTGVTFSTNNSKFGGSYSFDGSNDYVELGSSVSQWNFCHEANHKWSCTFWYKSNNAPTGYEWIVGNVRASTTDRGFAIGVHTNRRLFVQVVEGSSNKALDDYLTPNNIVPDNEWHHYAFLFDATLSSENVKIYRDGTQVDTANYGSWTPSGGDAARALYLGTDKGYSAGYLDGTLDDFGIWKRVLTTTEITALYNSGTGASVSTLSNRAGLKAHYGMNTNNGTAATLDDDLSSYADQATADAKWVSQDTAKSRVNISDDDIDWRAVNDGTNDAISYDLGSALSNTKWVCRFKMTITNADNSGLAPGQDRNQLAVGMFDKDSSEAYNGSSAGIYLQLHLDRDGTDRTYFSRSTGGQLDQLNSRADNFSNTTYYVEIKRTSDANATMTMYSDSGYSTSVLSTPENLTNCAGISDLRYFAIRNSHYNYGSDITGTIDDIQIYDGVTSLSDTFCTNDAPTTADLDSYTNLPVNTIFEQTDITPTYWWKQSDNTWKLDGTSEKQFDFSSNTGWTESSGNVTIDTSNTELDFHIESGTNGAKGYYDLGLANVSDTKWVLRFEKVNFSTINNYGEMWLGLSSITSANGANSGSMVAARPGDYADSDDYFAVQSFNSSTTEVTGNEVRFDYSTGVDYDIELKRTSATTVEAKIFTDNFGTLIGTSTDTISGTTGLRYLFVGSRNNTGAGNTGTNFAGTIQSIKFQNGTSEWME